MLSNKRYSDKSLIGLILQKGQSNQSKYLTLKFLPTDNTNQFVFIVSLKVDKRAVVRNLLKRRGRQIIRRHGKKIKKGFGYVMIFKPGATEISFKELEINILSLFKKLNLIND